MKKSILLFLFFIYASIGCFGAYLTNIPITLKQPNGKEINCFATGDEYFHWIHDKDNYTIVNDPKTGFYVYARLENDELIPTSYIVGIDNPTDKGLAQGVNISSKKMIQIRNKFLEQTPEKPTTGKSLINNTILTGQNVISKGTINNIVIFIRFNDQNEFSDDLSMYDNMFNNSSSGSNSMKNYYSEASYNQLLINSTFYPISQNSTVVSYQDSHDRSYYEPYSFYSNWNGYQGGDTGTVRYQREQTLLKNAINSVILQIPQSLNIDNDNDGLVDNVCFIVEGSVSGWGSLLWPHKSSLNNELSIINGKRVWTYNFQLEQYLKLPEYGIGVLCHEMFHTLGAPDLYHYNNDHLIPVGTWDLMESTKNPPQHMGSYMKYRYGQWLDSIPTIQSSGYYSLNPLDNANNNCFKIVSPNSTNEYIVIEYRKKTGTFENSLPSQGMLIYRINNFCLGVGNRNGPPDEVYVYRPFGTMQDNGVIQNATFSSLNNRTIFNNLSNPPDVLSVTANNVILADITIKDITETNNALTFTYIGNELDTIFLATSPFNGGFITGNTYYHFEDIATLHAIHHLGFVFSRWTENGIQVSTDSIYSFTVTGNRSLVAEFVADNTPPTNSSGEITNYEYWFDNDYSSKVSSSASSSSIYSLNTNLPTIGLNLGLHSLHIRFKDQNGYWSSIVSQFFNKLPLSTSLTNYIVGYEYWFDNDYNTKVWQAVSLQQSYNMLSNIPASSLSNGLHSYHIRYKDNAGQWSSIISQFFNKMPVSISATNHIVNYEYWFDNNYNAKVLEPISPHQTFSMLGNIPTGSLSNGLHSYHIRYQDEAGQWSSIISQFFNKMPVSTSSNNHIVNYEYWFDNNYNSKVSQSVSPQQLYSMISDIDAGSLAKGLHSYHIRYQDEAGQWSSIISQFFFRNPISNGTSNKIKAYKYWFDMAINNMTSITLAIPVNPYNLITEISACNLTLGTHTLNIQFLDDMGSWSSVLTHSFANVPFSPYFSVSILPNISSFCLGDTLQLNALVVDGGGFPAYQWHLNSQLTGNNNSFFRFVPQHLDSVYCSVIASFNCPASNSTQSEVSVFHQAENRTLQVKLFLEGLFSNRGMTEAQEIDFNSGVVFPKYGMGIADKIDIDLHQNNEPYSTVFSQNNVDLSINGFATVTSPCVMDGDYYIAIRNRNHLQTWSAIPVPFITNPVEYDFTTNALTAYQSSGADEPQIMVENRLYAFYLGDLDQSLNIDFDDFNLYEPYMTNGIYGFTIADFNGNGLCDFDDFNLFEPRLNEGPFAQYPGMVKK